MNIVVNSIIYNRSLVDGPGVRTVVFMQGCNVYCPGCQNKSSWDIKKGEVLEVKKLANHLKEFSINKKITISGGEPLMQKEALLELLKELKEFDIALYTSYELNEIEKEILENLTYIKTGKYIQELKTSTKPYVGSTNQEFRRIKN